MAALANAIALPLLAGTKILLIPTAIRATIQISFSTAATADVNAVWSKPTAAKSQQPLTSISIPAFANAIFLPLLARTKTLLMLTATR